MRILILLGLLSFQGRYCKMCFSQVVNVQIGTCISNTPWESVQSVSGDRFAQEYFGISKYGKYVSIGLDYFDKEKISLSSSLGFYESGGTVELYHNDKYRPGARWSLTSNNYSIPYIMAATNMNFDIFSQSRSKFQLITGVRLDYLASAFVIAPWASSGDTAVGGLRMDKFGNIGIGTSTNNGFKLAVDGDITINGKIICKNEFKVQEISVAWPDYVFREYALTKKIPLSISDMEQFVIANHHLPELPSEQEIMEEGFSMVEHYTALLRQVEMLSLQIIELNHKIKTLEQK